jgi:transposase
MLIIGDRIYSTINGMSHCLENGADFILRMRKNSFKTIDKIGKVVNLYEKFKHLKEGEVAEVQAYATNKSGEIIAVRICAKRKTQRQIDKAWDKIDKIAKSHKYTPTDEAKAFNEFIIVVTSLPKKITTKQVLETYRLRWQVEICFKRFKSILDFGDMPKKTDDSTMAWLSGKMMVALLMECVIANSFSPNGKNAKFDSEKPISGDEVYSVDDCD